MLKSVKKGMVSVAVPILLSTIFLNFFITASLAQALQGQLNVNSATIEELQQLPFIGASRAWAIIEYRNAYGPYETLDELLKSADIGRSAYEAIKPYLKLSGPTDLVDEDKSAETPPPPDDEKSEPLTFKVYPRITTSPGEVRILADEDYYDTLINFIHNAEKSIYLAMFLFKTTKSPTNRPAVIVKELVLAQKRGVKIRVLLEKSGHDDRLNEENQRTAKLLRKNHIKVSFDSPHTTTHTKIVVIDDRYAFVGSHNLTHSALAFNHEFSLLIDNHTLAHELIDYIKTIGM